ncbi:unnamed protein product [Prorocentrum cordatum]|uniref:Uncharacterized protein n=1 Tax=Prorocentrum cordatum TaxID=2364126 RepID=A0ABN9WJS3_9DINO|nr:unnamed protein product [Polarella glacialis]
MTTAKVSRKFCRRRSWSWPAPAVADIAGRVHGSTDDQADDGQDWHRHFRVQPRSWPPFSFPPVAVGGEATDAIEERSERLAEEKQQRPRQQASPARSRGAARSRRLMAGCGRACPLLGSSPGRASCL